MPNVAEVIRDHVTLAVECVDRLYLNAYVPGLQRGPGMVAFRFDIFVWPRLMLGNGPPVVRARPTLPTSNGRLEVGCGGEERRWICSRSYAANTSSG